MPYLTWGSTNVDVETEAISDSLGTGDPLETMIAAEEMSMRVAQYRKNLERVNYRKNLNPELYSEKG